MSSSYFKLKLLSKRINRLLPKKPKLAPKTYNDNYRFDKVSKNKCRICLNDGCISIYSDTNSFNLPDAIRTIGGVEINESDELPKYLCKECHSLLKGAVLFRNSAQKSNEFLLNLLSPITNYSFTINDEDNDVHCRNFENFKEPAQDFKCKSCNLYFDSSEKYELHKHSKNNKNVRIQCQVCHRILTSTLYEKHLKRHQSASHLVCEVCGKLYRKDNLIRHLQLHSNELPFQCQVCPYRGRFVESLKIHMRTHSGDKPFSCDKCALKFITKSNLNRHLLTHKKEKPFRCTECTRRFYTQRDLDTHLISDHIGNKEFGCILCGNRYGTKKALMRHELRVHKREKMAKGRMPLYMQAEFQNKNNQFL